MCTQFLPIMEGLYFVTFPLILIIFPEYDCLSAISFDIVRHPSHGSIATVTFSGFTGPECICPPFGWVLFSLLNDSLTNGPEPGPLHEIIVNIRVREII